MTSNTHPILTDAEVMEMLVAFYTEALQFLGVPKEAWADFKMGTAFNGTDGKANLISIIYSQRKILVCLQVLRMLQMSAPNTAGDAPTVYRSYGYKLARLWQQYLKTGEQRVFEQDKDLE